MRKFLKPFLFLLFLASGFAGLLYQVVWIRLAFASFGVITPVLSVVVSVFMAGLFAGSILGGRLAAKSGARACAAAYAACEGLIGLGALAVPALFKFGENWLLGAGEADSGSYLLKSALVMAGSIFPWCLAMGATTPLMLGHLRAKGGLGREGFSFLYLANTLGAMLGVLGTAVFAIEMAGFRGTLMLGLALNAAAALGGLWLSRGEDALPPGREEASLPAKSREGSLGLLFATGFASMAMEVAWTRAYTPVLQTQVYSFASILFCYLLATALGSFAYRLDLAQGSVRSRRGLMIWLLASASLPLILLDPRLGLGPVAVLLGILPFCAGLGYLTPLLVDGHSQGQPRLAGEAYAANILGSFLGPLFASYLLLAALGVKAAMLLLALPFVFYLGRAWEGRGRGLALGLGSALLGLSAWGLRTYEDPLPGEAGRWELRRDHTATVISYGEGLGKRLLVNGVGITHLTDITKVMAHLPMAASGAEKPKALVICFGMGATFRALTAWGAEVTAVELARGVSEAFGFYFADAAQVLARPGARVVIDDGRRFLKREAQSYDVITLDPPPPVEAAGSSLLYSEEFYRLAKSRLKPGGLLLQWCPHGELATMRAMTRALMAEFPHLQVYGNRLGGGGIYFLAGLSPLPKLSGKSLAARMPKAAREDLMEWHKDKDAAAYLDWTLGSRLDPAKLAAGGKASLTDDRPFNEYYLLRRYFRWKAGRS